mgnify:CR=1 FL=1
MKNIVCLLFNHKYRLLRKVTSTIREVYCARCHKKFGMNDDVQAVLPLTDEFVELHNELIKPS